MRLVHLAVIVVLALATLIFALQNLEIVTVSFLGFNASLALAPLVIVVYLIGMATGGSAWALVRRSIEGARRRV